MDPQQEIYRRRLHGLIESGDVAIVSAGFRCFTKIELGKQLGITQESLAFDSGFFPPAAVARMLESDTIDLGQNHTACIKTENFRHEQHGNGIRFVSSSYGEIDRLATGPNMPGINQYLDSTFGYYTLDKNNGFVLAHYNWHRFGAGKGGRVHDIRSNILSVGQLLTKRLNRIKQKCQTAKSVLFVIGETQGYRHMTIDNVASLLDDIDAIQDSTKKLFGGKCQAVALEDVSTAEAALRYL